MGKMGFRDTDTDPYVSLDTISGGSTALGIDNSDSDKFKMVVSSATGATPGGTASFIMTTGGQRTMPLQSAFMVYTDDFSQANVTGDGTVYTLQFPDTLFDQNSDFDGTSTFTAPVTGIYCLTANTLTRNIDASFTSAYIQFVVSGTSARTYQQGLINPGAAFVATTNLDIFANIFAPMTAGDTCVVQIMYSGGTKTLDVGEGTATNVRTFFSGYLTV